MRNLRLTRIAMDKQLLMMIITAVTPKHTLQNQFQLLKFMVSTQQQNSGRESCKENKNKNKEIIKKVTRQTKKQKDRKRISQRTLQVDVEPEVAGEWFRSKRFVFTIKRPQNGYIGGINEWKRRRKLAINKDKWILFILT